MPFRPISTRIDLAELTPMFELLCAQVGVSTGQGLRVLVASALHAPEKVDVSWLTQSGGRKYRPTISYESAAQRESFVGMAKALGLPESALLRYLVGKELCARWSSGDQGQGFLTGEQGTITPSTDYRVVVGKREKKGGRSVEVQLRDSELAALQALAHEHGEKNVQQVVIKLVKAFLLKQPFLSVDAVARLGQLNLELVRLSSALTNSLNGVGVDGSAAEGLSNEEIAALVLEAATVARNTAKLVSEQIKAASDRWEIQWPA